MRIASLGSSESKADQSDQVPPKRTRKRRHLRSSPPSRSSTSTSGSSGSSGSSSGTSAGSHQTVHDDVLVPLVGCAELHHQVASSCPVRGPGCDTETAFTLSLSPQPPSSAAARSSSSSIVGVTTLNYCGSPTGLLSQRNSPVDRTHSPGYDFRETTARRRNYLESTESSVQQMQQHPPACNQENQPHERSGRKECMNGPAVCLHHQCCPGASCGHGGKEKFSFCRAVAKGTSKDIHSV
ncbi:uncharacterized protein LOC110983111 [Acanthaster planci]|uniref:Uncharacterized protein LOC110983111 n=1 Tax=Acanthaster planci TaxID=133434 RepID=A0A8B7Z315_ACAPL|nr:uncharacterized protein LOC110983111 [Acanthaster planci]